MNIKWFVSKQSGLFLSLLVLLLSTASCSRELFYPDEEILSNAVKKKNLTIHANKKYNITPGMPLENVVIFSDESDYYLAWFYKSGKKNFKLLESRKIATKARGDFLKIAFINPALDYSHILLFFKNQDAPSLLILDTFNLRQSISLSMDDLKSIQILKNERKPKDEYLMIQDRVYRFDSFRYNEVFIDAPLPRIEKLDLSINEKEEPSLVLRNIGAFTARAVFTVSFPDLNNASFRRFVTINQSPKGQRFYSAGRKVHHADFKNYYSKYPMIEMTSPLKNMKAIKMYFHVKKGTGRIHIRAVVQKAGRIMPWPPLYLLEDKYSSEDSNAKVVKDQQGYAAYEILVGDEKN